MTSDYSEELGSDDKYSSIDSQHDSDSSEVNNKELALSPQDKPHFNQSPRPCHYKDSLSTTYRNILSNSGMNLKEMQIQLQKETGVDVTRQSVQCYLRRLHLKIFPNNLSDGKITMDVEYLGKLATSITHFIISLTSSFNLNTRQIVYDVLKQIDPKGMVGRLHPACKRRVDRTLGTPTSTCGKGWWPTGLS
ncbi:uncharacterized protein VP01_798g2 [Puccinia sorghi]|uniref:Uncharacterized protein n=1 Tax=Puccinia sorghi TaxID=27349 RepID=A0A0L6UBG9_9BASI|nr:uncharacterized protein VP01_798g2 [Puccinia sorghi]